MSQATLFANSDLADVSRAELEAEYLRKRRECVELRRENEALRKGTPMRDREKTIRLTDADVRRAVRENEAAIADAYRAAGEACRRRWPGPPSARQEGAGAVSFWREGKGSFRAAWTIPGEVRFQVGGASLVEVLQTLAAAARGDAAPADTEGEGS